MSGNGVDLAAIYQAVLALDRKFTRRLDEVDRRFDDLAGQVGALREEVATYHGSVVGHGILISELDERLGHVEHREPPTAA